MVDWFDFTINGNTARVWPKSVPDLVYVMVKENGQWKIDDMEASGQSTGNITY